MLCRSAGNEFCFLVTLSQTKGPQEQELWLNAYVVCADMWGGSGLRRLMTCSYLVCTNQVNHDEHVSNVNQPIWVVEAKSSQQVSGSIVTKGCVANQGNAHVEAGCNDDGDGSSFLHLRRL